MTTSQPRANGLPEYLSHLADMPAARFYGRGVEFMVGAMNDGPDVRRMPWDRSDELKTGNGMDRSLISRALKDTAPELEEIDPINLHASQRNITRSGVNFYADPNNTYNTTGQTLEPGFNAGNQYPTVYMRGPAPGGYRPTPQNVILTGHHRAAAALAMGIPLRARVIRHTDGGPVPWIEG